MRRFAEEFILWRENIVKKAKLVIGIISVVLFIMIMFQSCAAGAVNALSGDTADTSGGAGALMGFVMLVSGIIGIAARNTRGGTITAAILYFVGALTGFANLGTYGDLVVWSVVSAAFGVVFLISGIKMPKKQKLNSEAKE